MTEPYIIAEIGSNLFKSHKMATCLEMGYLQIQAAKDTGADAVKFQMFTARELYGPECAGKKFQGETDRWALPRGWIPLLAAHCEKVGIDFLCSAFSVGGYRFIDPYVKMHKLASPEATHPEIANYLFGHNDKPVLWSDGCTSSLPDVPNAIRLACVSNYPADGDDYILTPNYRPWGISDHTILSGIAVKARRMGATYFERHVDFYMTDGGPETPDTPVSYTGYGFERWVKLIRNTKVSFADDEPRRKYGRVKKDGGWYRPFPEESDG